MSWCLLFIHRSHKLNIWLRTFNILCMENSLYWSSINKLKSRIKIASIHAFCAKIASFFDGFVICGFISFVQFVVAVGGFFFRFPYSLRSPFNWFIKHSKDGDSKRRHPTNHFRSTKCKIAIRSGVFQIPLSLSLLSVTRGKNARVKFFPQVFLMRHSRRTKSERGARHSLKFHKTKLPYESQIN